MMDAWLVVPAAAALFSLCCCWTALVVNGLDPLRLLRSAFQTPQAHHLHGKRRRSSSASSSSSSSSLTWSPLSLTAASDLEAQPLLSPLDAHVHYSGKTPLYTDAVARLAASGSARELEALLRGGRVTRAVNSDAKALHFVRFAASALAPRRLPPDLAARVVVALQRFAHLPPVARGVRDWLCDPQRSPRECLALKCAVDDRVPLFDIVYRRVREPDVREEILVHFEQQARALVGSNNEGGGDFVPPIKLLCDIDDTMLAALFDRRYPDLTVYPGVHQFALELMKVSAQLSAVGDTPSVFDDEDAEDDSDGDSDDEGDQYDAENQDNQREREQQRRRRRRRNGIAGRVAFLTARPELLRKRSTQELRHCGFTHFTLLMGRLANFIGSERIASGKLRNFVRFRRLFAEHRFIFVGDNGQGDIDLGKKLLAAESGFGVAAVLIHDVIRNHVTAPLSASPPASISSADAHDLHDHSHAPLSRACSYRWRECQQHGMHLFRTYIGASFHLYALGLLPLPAIVRVVKQTAAAYARVGFDSEDQRKRCAAEILSDVAVVVDELPDHQALSLVASLHDDLVGDAQNDLRVNGRRPQQQRTASNTTTAVSSSASSVARVSDIIAEVATGPPASPPVPPLVSSSQSEGSEDRRREVDEMV